MSTLTWPARTDLVRNLAIGILRERGHRNLPPRCAALAATSPDPSLLPHEPEVAGLLARLLLTQSCRPSRTQPDGSLVLLGEQDRTRWDRALIQEGQAVIQEVQRILEMAWRAAIMRLP